MPGEILARLSRYWQEKPMSQIFARLGEELFRSGQRSKALEILRAGVEKYQGYITGYIVLATCLLENNEIDEAEITARVANQIDPYNPVVLNLLAEISFRKRELETGLSYLNEILAIDPTNEEIIEKVSRWQEEFRGVLQPTPPAEALAEEEKRIEEEVAKAKEKAIEEVIAITEETYKVEPRKEEVIVEAEKTEVPAEEKVVEEIQPAVEEIKEAEVASVAETTPLDTDILKVDEILKEYEEKEKAKPIEMEEKLPEAPVEFETIVEEVPLGEETIPSEEGIKIEEIEGLELGEEFKISEEKKEPGKEEELAPEEIEPLPLISEDGFIYTPEETSVGWDKVAEEAMEKIEELESLEFTFDEEAERKPKTPITPTMAEVYASQGNFKKAYEIYQQLISITNDPNEKKLYEKRLGELRELLPPDEI